MPGEECHSPPCPRASQGSGVTTQVCTAVRARQPQEVAGRRF